MNVRIKYFCLSLFLLLPILFLNGCGLKKQYECKPVLFPYSGYNYKAKSHKMSGVYTRKIHEIVNFHGVKIPIPSEWRYKEDLNGAVLKIFKNKKYFFFLSFDENSPTPSNEYENFKMIGCKNFSPEIDKEKSDKELFTDLFFFTEADLSKNPSFWQYYILWFKTEFFREAVEINHYTGKNLEAFQRSFDPKRDSSKFNRAIEMTIFPKKITPHSLTLISEINDDELFDDFLEMLEAANSP
ncbi:MAG: hypothetical protein GY874_06745 [Desulfobacteraceae bacterium]|nr:hypothetical protein [Desulfobacteraceae bacterium]